MSRVVFSMTVTEDDIMRDTEAMVAELEQDGAIKFPDEEARHDLILDVKIAVIDNYETRRDYFLPDYESEVLNRAISHGYAVGLEPDVDNFWEAESVKWFMAHCRGEA